MGRLTAEKESRIYELFKENLSYNKTAIAENVDPRTVRRIVQEKTEHAKNNLRAGTKVRESAKPTLLEAKMKVLYKELNQGRDPRRIIEEYGFDSDFVMKEYKKYCQFKQQDFAFPNFQRHLLDYFMAHNYPELRPFEEIYKEKGALTSEETKQMFNLGVLRTMHDYSIPSGWNKLTCKVCGRLIAFVDPTDQIGFRILYESQNLVHARCP